MHYTMTRLSDINYIDTRWAIYLVQCHPVSSMPVSSYESLLTHVVVPNKTSRVDQAQDRLQF